MFRQFIGQLMINIGDVFDYLSPFDVCIHIYSLFSDKSPLHSHQMLGPNFPTPNDAIRAWCDGQCKTPRKNIWRGDSKGVEVAFLDLPCFTQEKC